MKKVKKVKDFIVPREEKAQAFKGDYIFNNKHWFCAFISAKFSGKTVAMYNLIRHFIDKDIKFIIFAPPKTLRCSAWKAILKLLNKKKNEYEIHNSLFDKDGNPRLSQYMDEEEEEEEEEIKKENKPEQQPTIIDMITRICNGNGNKPEQTEPEPEPEPEPIQKLFFIIDDLAHETKKTKSYIDRLSKNHRHLNANVCLATQYLKDIKPEVCTNIDYVFMFHGISPDILAKTHGRLPCGDSKKNFTNKYFELATKPHEFCLIDLHNGTYRKTLRRSPSSPSSLPSI